VHVRTARLIVTAVARRSGVEESSLDEVRLAVGEACSQAVEVQRRNSPEEPVRLFLRDEDSRFEVVVMGGSGDGEVTSMGGRAVPSAPVEPPQPLDPIRSDDPSSGLARAVIAGLADDVEFSPAESGRLRIRMSWPTAEARQRAG
jgi:serine/threonine-protein kinase RsbW